MKRLQTQWQSLRSNRKYIFLALIGALLIASFQNCSGQGFAVSSSTSNLASQNTGGNSNTGSNDNPNPAPSPQPSPETAPSPTPTPPVVITPQPPPVYASLAEAAQNMAPGEWYELPAKNKISDVFPDRTTYDKIWAIVGPSSVVTAWSGGAVGEGKLFVWGGGHADYGGNEVYTFDLNTWTWTRVNNPSFYTNPDCLKGCATVDNTPTSVHSYSGIQYIPILGQFWVGGGSPYKYGGGTHESATFKLSTKTWTKLPDMPFGSFMKSSWDSISERLMIVSDGGHFFTYDPQTNTYNNKSNPNWSLGDTVGDFDPDRRIFIMPYAARNGMGSVYKMDLTGIDFKTNTNPVSWSKFNYQESTYNGNPMNVPRDFGYAGFVYHPEKKVFVLWDGDKDIWTLNPADWTWQKHSPAGIGPATKGATKGIYGRWRYLPEYGVFLGYNKVDGNPWIYKLPNVNF